MRTLVLFLNLYFVSIGLHAAPAAELELVQNIFKKYWQADSVYMQVSKKSIMGLLGRTTENSGRLLFSKGKLRIDFESPESSTIIFSEKKIILIKSIKEGLKEKNLVTYIDRKNAEKQHALMGLLFGDKKVWSQLELTKRDRKKDFISLHFKPKSKKSLPGVEKVAIVYDKSTNEIRAIKQWDDSENEVQFLFSNMIFDIAFKKNYFTYQIQKTDEVTKL